MNSLTLGCFDLIYLATRLTCLKKNNGKTLILSNTKNINQQNFLSNFLSTDLNFSYNSSWNQLETKLKSAWNQIGNQLEIKLKLSWNQREIKTKVRSNLKIRTNGCVCILLQHNFELFSNWIWPWFLFQVDSDLISTWFQGDFNLVSNWFQLDFNLVSNWILSDCNWNSNPSNGNLTK